MKALSFFLFLIPSFLHAQDNNPILDIEVKTSPVSGYSMPDGKTFYSDTTVFNAWLRINLLDTVGVEKVLVKLGRIKHSADVLDETYSFDTYRTGFKILIDLGNYSDLLHYYAEVRLRLADKTVTEPFSYSR